MHAISLRIDAGTAPKFGYSTSGLPAGSTLQLQRQTGATTWTTIATPPKGTNLVVTAPVLPQQGKYWYRMQAVLNGTLEYRTLNHVIYAYSNVGIATLCVNADPGDTHCGAAKTKINGTVYHFDMAIASSVWPNYSAHFSFAHTSCRSLSMTFANDHNSTASTWLKVHQASGDQVATAGHNALGHLTATLGGGQFYLDGSTEHGAYGVMVAGTGSCWSATGTY
jgi:hypothetical protein